MFELPLIPDSPGLNRPPRSL